LLAYAKDNGIKIKRIGISKAACDKCKTQLDEHYIQYEHFTEGFFTKFFM